MAIISNKVYYDRQGSRVNLYIFTSVSLENIRRGITARKWAVPWIDGRHEAARRTRAESMPVGSPGLFYCSDTQVFTTPLIVDSEPEDRAIKDVWDGTWYLPFTIRPIGELHNQVTWYQARQIWPFVREADNPGGLVTGLRVFAPVQVMRHEWDNILSQFKVDPEEYEDYF